MSLEPNKKIEDLLSRYAQKRREEAGADFQLHPATRKMLQGEVTRTVGISSEEKPPIRFSLWPGLALAAAVTALLALTLFILNRPHVTRPQYALSERSDMSGESNAEMNQEIVSPESFAKQKENRRALSVKIPAVTPQTDENDSSRKDRALGGGPILSQPDAPLPSAPFVKDTVQVAEDKGVAGRSALEKNVPAAAVAAETIPSTPTPFYSRSATSPGWRFVREDSRPRYRQNLQSPPPLKILESFDLVRDGNKVRFHDADGSVYSGELTLAPGDVLAEKETITNRAELNFQVQGTNLTLHRSVTFRGSISGTTPLGRASSKSEETKTFKSFGDASNRLIRGRISVGDSTQFEIRAIEIPK